MIGLITSLVNKGLGYFERKHEAKLKAQDRADQLEQAQVNAKIKRLEKGDDSAAKLDELSIKQRGWKDEYLLLLTTLPLGVSFVPGWAPIVELGFDALENIPEYYWYALGMIYIDTFGFRRMVRVAFEHWLQQRFGGVSG
ncbi:hypothetical protein B6A42_08775 [Vibrio coralliilyticus]|uniref:Holin of 3TMs, for gene-transfer release n=1 Tax=Vibrio coralliilyticus TaxID=190893 RepID=A0AAP7DG57_9VIBR|nr:hypothetical protein [Vibrio coralliilyticus]ARC92177.1 hypothetical protein B6A42_08775 [Vibrio coralliilyticus]NOJ25717.1 hypothetical protein [Vibrio coralliilyticus]NRF28083.1 hypothetical protein [Vibrio coralliilyticus]NRF82207.1 hypothetical protein [Vibrio coralliilyticus]